MKNSVKKKKTGSYCDSIIEVYCFLHVNLKDMFDKEHDSIAYMETSLVYQRDSRQIEQ